jgi:hypothetical protein
MNRIRTPSERMSSPKTTKLDASDTVLEPRGDARPQSLGIREAVRPSGGKLSVFSLARELGTSVAQIIKVVEQQLPNHRKLAVLSPTSIIGCQLAEVIRRSVSQGPPVRFPSDPLDIHWIG